MKTILKDLFYFSLIFYIGSLLMENFKPGLVSNYFDINKLLFIIIPLAILHTLINNKKR